MKNPEKIVESEKRLVNILNAFEDGIMFFDKEHRIQWFNKAAETRLSTVIKRPLEKGMNLTEYLPEKLGDAFNEDFRKSLRGEVVKFERVVSGSNEKSFKVFVTMSPIYDENKNVTGVVSISEDITDQIVIEEKLQQSNERYEYATKATNDIIWDHDFVNNKFIRSDHYTELFGYPTSQTYSFTSEIERIHPDDRDRFAEKMIQTLNNPNANIWKDEYRYLKKNGESVYMIDKGYIIRDPYTHKVLRIVGAMRDITERKLAELEKEKFTKEILLRNKEIEQFSFITSHELRHEFSKMLMLINNAKLYNNENEVLKDFFKEIEIAAKNINAVIAELNEKINTVKFEQKGTKQFPPITVAEEICLLDDDELFNHLNQRLISYTFPGIPIKVFEDVDSTLYHIKNKPQVNRYIFLDLNMPYKSGWDFLNEYRRMESQKDSPVIILSSSIDPVDQKRSENYKEVLNFFTKPLTKNLLEMLK